MHSVIKQEPRDSVTPAVNMEVQPAAVFPVHHVHPGHHARGQQGGPVTFNHISMNIGQSGQVEPPQGTLVTLDTPSGPVVTCPQGPSHVQSTPSSRAPLQWKHVHTPEGHVTSYPMMHALPPPVEEPGDLLQLPVMPAPPPRPGVLPPPPAHHQPVQEHGMMQQQQQQLPEVEDLIVLQPHQGATYSLGPEPLYISQSLVVRASCPFGIPRWADGRIWRLPHNPNPSAHIAGSIHRQEDAQRLIERVGRTHLPWTNWCNSSPSGTSLAFVSIDKPVTPYSEFMAGKVMPTQPPPDTIGFWSYSPHANMVNVFHQQAVDEGREIFFMGYRVTETQPVSWLGYVFRYMYAHARKLHSEKSAANYHLVPESFKEAQSMQIFAISNMLEMPHFRTLRIHLFTNFLSMPHGNIPMSQVVTLINVSLPPHWRDPEWPHKTAPGP